MASQFQLPFPRARRSLSSFDIYLVLVALAGLLVGGSLLPAAHAALGSVDLTFWVLAACVLPADIIRIPVWRRGAVHQITMSGPFGLALLTGWGAPLTVVVFVIASVVSDLIDRKPAMRIPFNAGQYALSIAAAGFVYTSLGGTQRLSLEHVPAFVAAALVVLLMNRLLVRVAVALLEQRPITAAYLLTEAQVELVEGFVQFSMVLVALLVAEHRLLLPAVLALPALPMYVAGRAADRAEALSRDFAEQLLRYRHLFVVADRFGRLPVCVNQDEILDVLGNLVLNAHRFAPPLTPIRLVAGRDGDSVVLAVEDDGTDFTPEQRERVFDQEVELDGSLPAGGGLAHGVAMARQLAHANSGELRAVDPGEAGGRARFELCLPLAEEAAQTRPPVDSRTGG